MSTKINVDKITLIKNQLLLRPIVVSEKKTASGIILSGFKKDEKIEEAEIVSVGYGVNKELVENDIPKIKKGDRVLYDMRYCTTVTLSTEEKEEELFTLVDFEHVRALL